MKGNIVTKSAGSTTRPAKCRVGDATKPISVAQQEWYARCLEIEERGESLSFTTLSEAMSLYGKASVAYMMKTLVARGLVVQGKDRHYYVTANVERRKAMLNSAIYLFNTTWSPSPGFVDCVNTARRELARIEALFASA